VVDVMWWHDGGGGASMMALTIVVSWVLVAGLVYGLLRGLQRPSGPSGGGDARSEARRMLDERLARGEIDEEQYARRRGLLDDGR
jgi:putative membrane protein